MKNSQLNKMKMFETIHAVIMQHQTTWSANHAFSDEFNEYSTKLGLLRALTTEHFNSSKPDTAMKKVMQAKIVDEAQLLGNILGALALKMGDTKLLVRNIYSHTEWMRGGALVKVNRFQNLLNDLVAHEGQLVEYGIDATRIQAFQECLAQFEELVQQPRLTIVGRKQMTQEIAGLIQEIEGLLQGQIDRIIQLFAHSDAKFVATFKNARMIVDHRGKRSKLNEKGLTEEPDDGENLDLSHE